MKIFPKFVTGAFGMAAVIALTSSTAQANLLVDPGFEAAPSQPNPILLPGGVNGGWSATFNGANFTAASAETGNLGLELTEAAGSQWNFEGTYQVIGSVSPGQQYTFTENFKAATALSSTYGPAFIQLTYFNATGTDLGTVETGGVGANAIHFSPTANWATYSVSATAPAGAVYVAPYVAMMENGSSTTIETLYADNGTLTLVPEPATIALLGMGLSLPLYLIRRRK
jgi:PEP-CTERM motif